MAINMSYFAGAGAQFFDDNGVPLAGGKLYTYSAGTTTPAVTYTTRAGTVNNTNPIILDAAGRTPNEIWFNGGLFYKFVLKSSTDVLIGSYDNISSINDVSQTTNLITVSGTNDLVGTSVVPVTGYSAGFQVSFVAVATNTGPMTIDIDTTGAKSIVTDVSTPLAAGDVPIGKVVYLEYDGTRFQVINPAAFKNLRVAGVMNLAQGSNIASASTINLTTATGNSVHVTGTTTITAITLAQGYQRTVIFDDVLILTNSANLVLTNGSNITTAAGDIATFIGDAAGVVRCVSYSRVPIAKQIQSITASVGSGALTLTLNPTSLDFRSSTLGSGTVNTRTVTSAISLVISNGSTLGTVNATMSRIALLAIDNAGTVELAAVNIAGGNNLDETTLISTTAEGGAGAADSANVIYSTTARTNVPFRVVGYIESTQATAGTWATAPSTIQGSGGQPKFLGTSMVRLDTQNGYGSTNTRIPRFTNIRANQGNDITYADSATLGSSFTINTAGVYAISFTFSAGASEGFAVTLNESAGTLSSAAAAVAVSEVLQFCDSPAAGSAGALAWTGYLAAGSIIRPHTNAGTSSVPRFMFTITRVA